MAESRHLTAVKHFASHTGIHSVGSIADARSSLRRVLWACVLMAALAVYIYQVHEMVLKYMAHPVKTTTTVDYKMPMDFPAVTICNLNPIKGSVLRSKRFQRTINNKYGRRLRRVRRQNKPESEEEPTSPPIIFPSTTIADVEEKEVYEYIGDSTTVTPTPAPDYSEYELPTSTANPVSTEKSLAQEKHELEAFKGLVKIVDTNASEFVESSKWENRTTTSLRRDAVVQGEFMYLVNSIDEDVRKQLTYNLGDLLIDCSFNGRNCIPDDFVRLQNPKYGLCFVFNVGRNSSMHQVPVRQVNSSGADVSLELTLYVDQQNYVTEAAPVAGYKVVIHNPSRPPIPEKDGYVVGPGHFTALSVVLNEIERAPRPYGECKNFTDADNRAMNMFLTQLPMTKPTLSSCMKTCEQLEIIKRCRCYSLLHGFDNAPAFDSVRNPRSFLPACTMGPNTSQFQCLSMVTQQVAAGHIPCKTNFCKDKECQHSVYQASTSSAAWPAENIFDRFRAMIQNHPNPNIRMLLKKSKIKNKTYVQEKLFYASNFLKVKVFFEDLTIVNLKTQSSYGIHELLSELGGQGGLWLGVSVITLFELLELFGDAICICLWKKQHESPTKIEMT